MERLGSDIPTVRHPQPNMSLSTRINQGSGGGKPAEGGGPVSNINETTMRLFMMPSPAESFSEPRGEAIVLFRVSRIAQLTQDHFDDECSVSEMCKSMSSSLPRRLGPYDC